MLTPGTILGERYEIIQKIGAGGMSIVYKAKCNKLQRFVAIKVLREEFVKDESFVKKFRAEALSAASLSHPNIVGIYDVGADQDLHYIVMEYVEGKTLKEVIEEQGPMSSEVVLEYGMQILLAVRHAHRKQIIHRDIKPQNILVTHDKVLKVTDFGIAHAVDSSTLVATGNAIGSVHYFSPEQAKGKYINETSDLYSCGIVLFELATKRLPFEADSHVSIALKHINEEIPRPTTFNPSILPGLEQIILKTTHKRQELRYQTADDMMQDMKKVSADPNIILKSEEVTENTILLTDEEVNQIRQSERVQGSISHVIPSSYSNTSSLNSEQAMERDLEEDLEEDDTISPMHKVLVSIGGVLATLVLVGIISTAFFVIPSMQKDKFIAVPEVIGKTVPEAEDMVKKDKLVIEVTGEEESVEATPGTIIKQTPGTEGKIKAAGIIEVVLAKVPQVEEAKEAEIPDVVGVDSSEAQRMLESKKLKAKVERAYDNELELGKVISQYPEANSTAKEGDVITLTVSKGRETVMSTVPTLVTLTKDQAITSLRNANLTLGRVKEEESETVPKGIIMTQSLLANTQIEQGTSINVVISLGKPEVIPEEPIPVPEVPVEPGQDNTTPPTKTTKSYAIKLPQGYDKEDYHVLVTLEGNQGTTSLVYDGRVQKDQFPFSITVEGSGEGVLVTLFDSVEVYRDPFDFNN